MFYWAVGVVLFVAFLKFRRRPDSDVEVDRITEDLLITEPMTPPKQPPSPSASRTLSPSDVPLPPSPVQSSPVPMEIVSPHRPTRYHFSKVRRRHFAPY